MSIFFDAEKKLFKLDSSNSSYIFGINEDGILLHHYYGAPIDEADVSYLSARFGLSAESKSKFRRALALAKGE